MIVQYSRVKVASSSIESEVGVSLVAEQVSPAVILGCLGVEGQVLEQILVELTATVPVVSCVHKWYNDNIMITC